MGRPREFEIDDALDAAMEAFWTHGYEATSLSDLIEATGLQKGSLYKAFGDKHSLFMQSLDYYVKMIMERQREALQSGKTPKQALTAWFEAIVEFAVSEGGQLRGCFAMNTLVELGPHDEVVCNRLLEHQMGFLKLISTHIKAGQDQGMFRTDVPADRLAQTIFTFVLGMVSGLKGAFKPDDARRLSSTMMKLLE